MLRIFLWALLRLVKLLNTLEHHCHTKVRMWGEGGQKYLSLLPCFYNPKRLVSHRVKLSFFSNWESISSGRAVTSSKSFHSSRFQPSSFKNLQSSRLHIFFKIGVPKNFASFTKNSCVAVLSIKLKCIILPHREQDRKFLTKHCSVKYGVLKRFTNIISTQVFLFKFEKFLRVLFLKYIWKQLFQKNTAWIYELGIKTLNYF